MFRVLLHWLPEGHKKPRVSAGHEFVSVEKVLKGKMKKATPVAGARVEVVARVVYRRDYQEVGDQPVSRFGSDGSGDGQFSQPHSVACNLRGNIVVPDFHNHRIQCLIEMASSCLSLGHRDREMSSLIVLVA